MSYSDENAVNLARVTNCEVDKLYTRFSVNKLSLNVIKMKLYDV